MVSGRYQAINGAVRGHNGKSYNNRPLYCNNTNAFILSGDRPLIRLAQSPFIHGVFMMAFVHSKKGKWLQECNDITMSYTADKTVWIIRDSSFNGVAITLTAIPMRGVVGMTMSVSVEGAGPGDQIVWVYGGAEYRTHGGMSWEHSVNLSWDLDITGYPDLSNWGFSPESCRNNTVRTGDGWFLTQPMQDSLGKTGATISVTGAFPRKSKIIEADAGEWADPLILNHSHARELPIVCGTLELDHNTEEFYWAMQVLRGKSLKAGDLPKKLLLNPAIAWRAARNHVDSLAHRVVVNTPDARLNAMASVSAAVIDGVWYDSVYVHGAMLWNTAFPGWRILFGGSMYGWHERMIKEAQHYISYQVKHSDKKEARADLSALLSLQASDSRFYGAGRIEKDQAFYNMQSQFFDQLITEWRHTGDMAFERLLRPALELHLQWEKDCFDPDDDGVYESYINTWPTDSQWYNGGGTAEETSYAYKGHEAAMEMAIHSADTAAVHFHRKMLEKIKKGFFTRLWIADKGYSGASREQIGYQRLHEDPWLYSIFLPIDVGLENRMQAAASLYYSEWALQNDRMPLGGRRVWTSSWVPGLWSIRQVYPGDNYHLALAYLLSGLADDGWDILKGSFLQSGFNDVVPGNLGSRNSGTDFSDCSHMFARTLVEGMFGYRPDYPNNVVRITPQFPKEWDSASISIPDYRFQFHKVGDQMLYRIGLRQAAAMEIYLPVRAGGVKEVRIDGEVVKWELQPGYGQSLVHLRLTKRISTNIIISVNAALPQGDALFIEKNPGEPFTLTFKNAKIISFTDSQHILNKARISGSVIEGITGSNAGYHTLFIKIMVQQAPQWRIVHLKINDQISDTAGKGESDQVHANLRWDCVNIRDALNADVRNIYKQQYLSPRPNTVSVRIGVDGYSPWTFPFWKEIPPVIQLDSVKILMKDSGRIMTPQQVPFYWYGEEKNIAFTSLWDNWPRQTTIPVNKDGDMVYLLISGSTNPMQCHIANAWIRLEYADDSKDTLSLIPPYNYWNLSPIAKHSGGGPEQGNTRDDYTAAEDSFCVPKPWPLTVQLGRNCRAMLLKRRLRKGVQLKSITLQTLSPDVVVGLMGITVMHQNPG
jgi:hypothetical protein